MPCDGGARCASEADLEKLVKSITEAVLHEIAGR
jgi:hypothetical protein